ncbi:MAG: hypothetical protein FJ215_09370 [Ignavibacteria bacterium]|nr:hypothetical protein [Ignavibacteria bacterium]
MKPFWVLNAWILKNSLRRGLRNPLRGILVVVVLMFLLGYLVGVPLATIFGSSDQPAPPLPAAGIRGFLFILILFHVALLSLPASAMIGKNAVVRESDVNFLFPSPIPRVQLFRTIILFRATISSIVSFMAVIFYSLLFGTKYVRAIPEFSLVLPPWFSVLYPVTFFCAAFGLAFAGTVTGANIVRGKWSKRPFIHGTTGLAAISLVLLVHHGLESLQSGESFFGGILAGLNHPVLYVILFPLRSMAEIALIAFMGWTPSVVGGLIFWPLFLALSYFVLVKNQEWLYDLGVHIAQRRTAAREQLGNPAEVIKRWVQKGVAKGSFRPRQVWLAEHWTPQGVWALLWRNHLIYWRLNRSTIMILDVIVLLSLFVLWYVHSVLGIEIQERLIVGILIGVQAIFVALTLGNGFITSMDIVKRMDMQKPFPFSPRLVIFVEVLHLVGIYALSTLLLVAATLLTFPDFAQVLTIAYLVGVSCLFPASLSILFLLFINPDMSDPVQRIIVGLLQLPVIALSVMPGLIPAALGVLLKLPLFVSGLSAIVANIVWTFILIELISRKYRHFNPAE